MHITSTDYTVADYCQAMERKEIIVNRAYQRSDKVWLPVARSFLIETILKSLHSAVVDADFKNLWYPSPNPIH